MRALILLVLAAPLVAAPVPKELKDKRPNYQPMAVGDKREYVHPANPDVVSQVREITAVEERNEARYYTQKIASSNQTNVMKVDKTGVYMAEQNDEKYDPPYPVARPDMKEGDKWECRDELGMVRTVGKAAKVETPAGTFTAIPITVSYPQLQGSADTTVWYADGVGLVRLDTGGRTTLVLKKYTPGKDPK